MSIDGMDDAEVDSRDVEMSQLLDSSQTSSSSSSSSSRRTKSPTQSSYRRPTASWKVMGGLLCLSLLACHWVAPIILPGDVIRKASSLNGSIDSNLQDADVADESSSSFSSSLSKSTTSPPAAVKEQYIAKTYDSRLDMSCPAITIPDQDSAAHDSTNNPRKWYDSMSSDIAENASEYLLAFQQQEYDSWGHSYDQIRRGMRHFKQKYLVPNLASNMSIYDAGCGYGLNLYMTLELLPSSVKDIVVYGSDDSGDSVRVANQLLASHQQLPDGAQFGLICQADPTNLNHVPDSSMDLVFTGYIDPLSDPLDLKTRHNNELSSKYAELCEAKSDIDPELHQLNSEAQHKQNTWYRSRVDEMIRIAKPGAPIIVEQVSYPLCEALYDGGGVHQAFWKSNIDMHGWEIDPESIEFEEDSMFRRRYHVFMRKNTE